MINVKYIHHDTKSGASFDGLSLVCQIQHFHRYCIVPWDCQHARRHNAVQIGQSFSTFNHHRTAFHFARASHASWYYKTVAGRHEGRLGCYHSVVETVAALAEYWDRSVADKQLLSSGLEVNVVLFHEIHTENAMHFVGAHMERAGVIPTM